MQYEIVSSEITGGVPVFEHPGTDKECPAQSVRYEVKMADRKWGQYGVVLSNWNGVNSEVSRRHSSQVSEVRDSERQG